MPYWVLYHRLVVWRLYSHRGTENLHTHLQMATRISRSATAEVEQKSQCTCRYECRSVNIFAHLQLSRHTEITQLQIPVQMHKTQYAFLQIYRFANLIMHTWIGYSKTTLCLCLQIVLLQWWPHTRTAYTVSKLVVICCIVPSKGVFTNSMPLPKYT